MLFISSLKRCIILLSRFDSDPNANIQMVSTSSTVNNFAGPQLVDSSHIAEYNDGALPRAATVFSPHSAGQLGNQPSFEVSVRSNAEQGADDQQQAEHDVAVLKS